MTSLWRNKEQTEWLVSKYPDFAVQRKKDEKDALKQKKSGKLVPKAGFWSRIYEDWFHRWPVVPTQNDIVEHKGEKEAIAVLRKARETVSYRHIRCLVRSLLTVVISKYTSGFITEVVHTEVAVDVEEGRLYASTRRSLGSSLPFRRT